MNYLKSIIRKLQLNRMNRTYFEPKQLNADDHLNLLHRNEHMSDVTTSDTDDDIELCHQINHKLNSSHQSLIDRPINEILIDFDTNSGCHEWIKATAWGIKQSVQFFLVYLILIVLNAFILIWELSDGGDRKICIILEGIITLMFMGEVAVQIITEEWPSYWSSWLNRIDFVICILCVLLYIVFASVQSAPHSHYSVGNYMDAIIVGIRYGMQAIRLIRFAQRGHENRKMLNQTQVKFDSVSTLSVLNQHGVSLPNKGKNVEQNKNLSSFDSFRRVTNRLFNPRFHALINDNSNELKRLKNNVDDSIEMVEDPLDHENKTDDDDELERKMKGSEEDLLDNRDKSDNYVTDDTAVDDPMMNINLHSDNQLGFMYDSEQMRVYQNISNERINSGTDTGII
eukprot:272773_1